MKLLFVCSANMLRSPTAEKLFATYPGVETASAGTLPAIDKTCHQIEEEDVAWADMIFCMQRRHRDDVERRFAEVLGRKALIVLGIPDDYERNDPELIRLLRRKVEPFLDEGHEP